MTTLPPAPAGKSLQLAARLEEEILRSGLRPGWRLPSEEQLSLSHGVSRTVVREAIQALKARGLVTSRRGGGTYVAEVNAAAVGHALRVYARLAEAPRAPADLLALRACLLGAAARDLATRREAGAVRRLQSVLELMRRSRDRPEPFVEAVRAFRRALAAEAGNALSAALLDGLDAPPSAAPDAAARARLCAEHEALWEAVRAGSAAPAAALAEVCAGCFAAPA